MHEFKYGVDSSVLLLIVDVQQAFISFETQHILPKIQELLPGYAHVAATQFFNPTTSNYRKLLHWKDCGKHEPGFSLALDLPDRSMIFQKSSYSCLTPGLKKTFLDLKIQDVHFCGLDTDACVLMLTVNRVSSWISRIPLILRFEQFPRFTKYHPE
ncbi:isochorismatase family protein [Acidithiobacillus thiooxidans]|uniref:isochorismatase family protein n=1 Tax=Acidithiobacillus thiooxidans TaxID=930 RepID=UPI00129D9621|nr:isochorismatase family protein [Acidithiobacillus thiooxidans]